MAIAALVMLTGACSGDGSEVTASGASTTNSVSEAPAPKLTPLIVDSGPDVVPVRGSDGRYHLLWTVPVLNATSLDLTVTGIVVEADGEEVLSLDAAGAAEVTEVLGSRTADPAIGPAQGANLFLTADFAELEDVPTSLVHRVTVESDKLPDPVTSSGGEVQVDHDAVVPVMAPPLPAGKNYVAADTCCTSTRHIRAGLPINNGIWFAAAVRGRLGAGGR